MANWCRYCKGSYPKYWCEVTNEYIPWSIVERSCKNNGYKCSNYYISTLTGVVLKKDKNDKVLDSIKYLRDEFLEQDTKYSDLLSMYDYIGPQVAKKIDEDPNRKEVSTKVYSILTRISKLVEKEEIDKATGYYSQMVGALINKYNLGEFYEETEEKIELADKVVKKHKIQAKTLD